MRLVPTIAALCSMTAAVNAADIINQNAPYQPTPNIAPAPLTFKGYANVLDGRTLYFPSSNATVRLAHIDACELPQWALNPKWTNRSVVKAPQPVPCGALAKAWLKRTIGKQQVSCRIAGYDQQAVTTAYCYAGKQDVALEMLRVGWARVVEPISAPQLYVSYQDAAMSKRYGMWETYVLDMNEWRQRAIDKSLERQPYADFNILADRKSEISPPFQDARQKPKRTDR